MLQATDFWTTALTKSGAHYKHDDHPDRPHIRLPNRKHTDEAIRPELAYADPTLSVGAAKELVGKLSEKMNPRQKTMLSRRPLVVVSTSTSGNIMAHQIAAATLGGISPSCTSNFFERVATDSLLLRLEVRRKAVLLYTDTVTAGDMSIFEFKKAVEAAGGEVLPYVLTFCNRSNRDFITEEGAEPDDANEDPEAESVHKNRLRILSVVNLETIDNMRRTCIYCGRNSPVIEVYQDTPNWNKLTKPY